MEERITLDHKIQILVNLMKYNRVYTADGKPRRVYVKALLKDYNDIITELNNRTKPITELNNRTKPTFKTLSDYWLYDMGCFSVRTCNCLSMAGIENIEQLSRTTAPVLLRIKNFGIKSLIEVRKYLNEQGYQHNL